MNKQLKKYLSTRAVSGPWQIEGIQRNDFRAAIIIPALDERQSLPQTLASLARNPAECLNHTLILIVINNRCAVAADQLQDNQETLVWLRSQPYPQLNLAWIDASSSGFEMPSKEGVGLARKIGFDLALAHLDWPGEPLLISLDADTLVDANYLSAIQCHFRDSDKGGATVPFRHQAGDTPEQEAAIRRYELYLRSYLFGLQQAASPYAYHTIGSAFACRAKAYIGAGGMNRRHAAEDFYFLQQLAKTCGVELLSGTVVQPSPRSSDRVPFGTGKAVQGQVEEGRMLFQFSSVAAFSVLRDWLRLVDDCVDFPADDLLQRAGHISPLLRGFLLELKFAAVWQKLQANHADRQRRLTAFHGWFDGLRTRQLLSCFACEDGSSAEELVAKLLEWGGYPGGGRMDEQLRLLETLQRVRNS